MIILNWTLATVLLFIFGILMIFMLSLMIHSYIKNRFQYFLFLIGVIISCSFWCILEGIAQLLLLESLYLLSVLVWISNGFFLILLIDSISRESVDPLKLVLVTAVGNTFVIFTLEPGSIELFVTTRGDLFLNAVGRSRVSLMLLTLMLAILVLVYSLKIYINSPENLRFYSSLHLFGSLISSIGGAIAYMLGIFWLIPGIYAAPISTGISLIVISFIREPKLGYVLPFKAIRLSVIEIEIGMPIFTHIWNVKEDSVSEGLFSGMLHGVSLILNESVKRGNVREIHLEKAVLIMQRSEEFTVACVLVTTKSSRSLRQALDTFADKFFKKYSQFFSNPSNVDNFKGVSELVLECFPFVPEYNS